MENVFAQLDRLLTDLGRLTGCGFVWKRSRHCLSEHRLRQCNIHRCGFCDDFKRAHGIRRCLRHDTGTIPKHLPSGGDPDAFEIACPAGALELVIPIVRDGSICGVVLAGPFSQPGKDLPGLPMWQKENKTALVRLARHLVTPLAPALARRSRIAKVRDPRIQTVLEFLDLHFREAPDISVLAGMVFLSASRFSHLFRQECGVHLSAYVNDLRLAEALDMLRESDNGIAEIAAACGFSDPNHFSTAFKKKYGKSPRTVRKEWLDELHGKN
ncbi:MAG: helix-turn-helix domain-containing protein [Lentisphaeria bacterium]|nr:helix-turn-helix domain-containing protein [Lentisphaeria bacterium]